MSARVYQVIISTDLVVGRGTEEDPKRHLIVVYTLDGQELASFDSFDQKKVRQFNLWATLTKTETR